MRRPRASSFLALAVGAVLALAPTAQAGSIQVTTPTTGGNVRFTALDGELNNMTVAASSTSVTFTDTTNITVGPLPAGYTCTGGGSPAVTCTGSFASWGASLGNLDDVLTASGPLGTGFVFFGDNVMGGPGGDTLTGSNENEGVESMLGEEGNDVINTRNVSPTSAPDFFFSGGDLASGDDGDDTLTTGNGNDQVFGDAFLGPSLAPGRDVISTGAGRDGAGGSKGDGDVVDLGPGDDFATQRTDDGNGDVIRGGDGFDELSIQAETMGPPGPEFDAFSVDLEGGTSTKTNNPPGTSASLASMEDVFAADGNDRLLGNAAVNLIQASRGNDAIDPRAAGDTVEAEEGDDTIELRDGSSDRASCGPGTDTVQADQFDELSACERVTVTRVRAANADLNAPTCRVRKVKGSYRASAFFRGFSADVTCNEAASLRAAVVTRVRRVRGRVITSRIGDLTLAERSARLGNGRRVLRLKPSRKLGRRLGKRFKVRLEVDARDQFGNRRVVRKTVRVKPAKKKRRARRR